MLGFSTTIPSVVVSFWCSLSMIKKQGRRLSVFL